MTPKLVRKERFLTFVALPDRRGRFPACAFLGTLDARSSGQFESLARLMDRAHAAGFDFSGRVSKIKGSKVGLLELRLTPRGGVSPHLRMFAVIRCNTVYLVFGYAKKDRALDMSIVARSESIVADWDARSDGPRQNVEEKRAKTSRQAKPRRR